MTTIIGLFKYLMAKWFPKNLIKDDVSLPLYYRLAQKEIGVSEVRGDGNNPRILEYHAATTLHADADEIPWCAAFVCWCLESAGFKSTRTATARSFLRWGHPCVKPFEGCIVVLERGQPWQGHVGFLVKEDEEFIHILGGNQHDKVCVDVFPKSKVIGYRSP